MIIRNVEKSRMCRINWPISSMNRLAICLFLIKSFKGVRMTEVKTKLSSRQTLKYLKRHPYHILYLNIADMNICKNDPKCTIVQFV